MFKRATQMKYKKRTFFFAGHCCSQQMQARRDVAMVLKDARACSLIDSWQSRYISMRVEQTSSNMSQIRAFSNTNSQVVKAGIASNLDGLSRIQAENTAPSNATL